MLPSFNTSETRGKLVQEDLKTSRTTTGDGEKHRPIADQRVHCNNPKNNCGTHFGSIPFLVSKVANKLTLMLCYY